MGDPYNDTMYGLRNQRAKQDRLWAALVNGYSVKEAESELRNIARLLAMGREAMASWIMGLADALKDKEE